MCSERDGIWQRDVGNEGRGYAKTRKNREDDDVPHDSPVIRRYNGALTNTFNNNNNNIFTRGEQLASI